MLLSDAVFTWKLSESKRRKATRGSPFFVLLAATELYLAGPGDAHQTQQARSEQPDGGWNRYH